jgi:predicted TPR repeat methyltransferase
MGASVAQSLAAAKKHIKAGELSQARDVYLTVLMRFPGNKRVSVALAALEKPIGSNLMYETQPTAEQVNRLLQAYNQKRFDAVIDQASSLIKSFPNAAVVFNVMAAAQSELDQKDAAIESYRRALKIDPNYAEVSNNLGTVLKSQGKFAQAVKSYQNAIRLKPDYGEAHNNLGNALRNQGNPQDAIASYETALRLKPNFVDAHNNKGNALRDLNRPKQAIECFATALLLNPNYVQAHNNTGNALRDLGRDKDAIASYRKALLIAPDFPDALRNLATCLHATGETDAAMLAFERVLQVAPSDTTAQHFLAALSGQSTTSAPRGYVTNLFDGYAPRFETSLVDTLGYKTPAVLRALFDAYVPRSAPINNAVDLGCGTGLMGDILRPRVKTLVGIDLSSKMVDIAKEKAIYDQLIVDDLTAGLNACAKTFDLFVAADVLVYLGDLNGLFKAVRQAANPKAHVLFSTEHHAGPEDYKLLPSGRYAHARTYVEQVSMEAGLDLVAFETSDLRKEKNTLVVGGIYLLRLT